MPWDSAPRIVVCGRDAEAIGQALAADHHVQLSSAAEPLGLDASDIRDGDVVVWVTGPAPSLVEARASMSTCRLPVVVVTGDASEEGASELLRAGASEVVFQGDVSDLPVRVARALARAEGSAVGAAFATPDGLLAGAAEAAELLLLVTDADGVIEYVNPYWCAQTGYAAEEAIGRTPRILKSGKMATGDYARLWQRISSGQVWHGRLVNRRADGSEYAEQIVIAPIVLDGVTRHYLHVGVDATATVGLADMLGRAKRFETLGWAIGGMAHEFNNIFGVVLANAEHLAAVRIEGGESARAQAIEDVLREVERGRTVVRRLLMYTGRWRIRPEPVDLGEEVTKLAATLAEELPEIYQLGVSLSGSEQFVARVDRHALSEVVSQLVGNAQDSMPSGGRIELRVGPHDLDEAFCDEHTWARPGHFVSVSVADEGVGMDERTRNELFDLLSGDKMEGGVSGLGPAMTYGFIKQHGGYVLVESAPGHGTVVELLFPLAVDVTPRPKEGLRDASGEGAKATRTVLYVEDNARLRRAARRILESAGFQVKEAEDGRQALDVLRSSEPVDVVLSDLVMPDIGGAALYRLVQEMDAPPRFLFTTGHADAIASGAEQVPSDVPYVLKPWTREQLISAIERVLAD